MRGTALFCGLLVICMSMTATQGHACSCMERTLEEVFAESQYVFSATVTGLRLLESHRTPADDTAPAQEISDSATVEIRFDPHVDYKGDSSDLDFLYTRVTDAACGAIFRLREHAVFLVGPDGWVSYCGSSLSGEKLTAGKLQTIERLGREHAAGHPTD